MKFEWDEEKNQANIRKHGFGFERAKTIFDYERVVRIDDRFDYGEVREVSTGLMSGITITTVTHTDRKGTTRIISARPASRKERKVYEKATRKDE